MPTTTVLDGDGTDWTAAVRALGARTDNAGTAVIDLAADEDRLINHLLTEGFLTTDAFVVQDGATGMQVTVGSGTAKADIYVVEGDDVGQHPYLVRMDDAQVTITLDAGDADPRIDEIYLVVRDATYDGGTITEAQLAYRKGDAAATPSAPGPDGAWDAWVLLASIAVAASASTVTAGDITDGRSTSNLAAVLRDALGEQFADVSGDTFTGPVTFQALGTFADGVEGSLGSDVFGQGHDYSVWPDGLSWQELDGGRTWAPGNTGASVFMFNFGNKGKTWQLHVFGAATPVLSYRTWSVGSAVWGDWHTLVSAENPGAWEVDNSTEVASAALTGTLANVASVSLSIPSDWGSWKCEAHATYTATVDPGGSYNARIAIDGTGQQIQAVSPSGSGGADPGGVAGRRTGMTTTGARTVSLQMSEAGANVNVGDIFLYARAVRTG